MATKKHKEAQKPEGIFLRLCVPFCGNQNRRGLRRIGSIVSHRQNEPAQHSVPWGCGAPAAVFESRRRRRGTARAPHPHLIPRANS